MYTHTHTHTHTQFQIFENIIYIIFFSNVLGKLKIRGNPTRASGTVRGCADKSIAQPTSLCRTTESVVSLERGVCSCAELQVFSCYRG
jgi:hypothetical protein